MVEGAGGIGSPKLISSWSLTLASATVAFMVTRTPEYRSPSRMIRALAESVR